MRAKQIAFAWIVAMSPVPMARGAGCGAAGTRSGAAGGPGAERPAAQGRCHRAGCAGHGDRDPRDADRAGDADRGRPTDELGRKLAQVISDDLSNTGLFKTLGPGAARAIAYGEVTAPDYASWGGVSAQGARPGYVRANGDGGVTVGCYLYDVALNSELVRQGFVVGIGDWRRAAHKCADAIYARLTGEGPYFDSQVVYVSETGPKNTASSAWRSWTRTAPTTISSPTAVDRAHPALRARPALDRLPELREQAPRDLCLRYADAAAPAAGLERQP